MRKSIKFIGVAGLALFAAASTLAQDVPQLVLPQAPVPSMPAMPPVQSDGVPPAIAAPAPMPMQGEGGFATSVPTPGAADAAERQTLDGAEAYTRDMLGQSSERLESLVGAEISPETESDLETMMRLRRSNMLLSLKNEEAELAVSLWGTLYNNEHAQAWRDQEREDAEARAKAESEAAAARQAQLTQLSAQQAEQSKSIMPVVFEINGGSALLLVPSVGEVLARVGTVLPGGWEVTSVSSSGVAVQRDGERNVLGFGVGIAPSKPAASTQSVY